MASQKTSYFKNKLNEVSVCIGARIRVKFNFRVNYRVTNDTVCYKNLIDKLCVL